MKRLFLFLFLILAIGVTPCSAANEWRNISADFFDGDAVLLDDFDDNLNDYVLEPLERALYDYRQGAKITYASASTVTVAVGRVVCTNATLFKMRRNTSAVTVAWTDIDTGAEEASTTYYLYAVGDADATTFTVKISKSSTAPGSTTYYARLGSFYNDSSSNITYTDITNDDNYYGKTLGAWVSKSVGTTYQATTDGIVTLSVSATNDGGDIVDYAGYTDIAAAPTTIRARDTAGYFDGQANYAGYSFPVRKGHYYKIVASTITGNGGGVTPTMFWIPSE